MSCEQQNGKAARFGATVGVPKLASKGAQLAGAFNTALKKTGEWGQDAVDQALERRAKVDRALAPAADKILKVVNTLSQYGASSLGSMLLMKRLGKMATSSPLRAATIYADVAKRATALAATKVEGLARQDAVQTIVADAPVFYFFKRRIAITCWKSGLTPALNRLDTAGFKQAAVISSKGLSMSLDGVAWHRGISVVKTPNGNRTITHLQSLSFPAKHYYFDRPLSTKETVGIIAGQSGYFATNMNGFIGQIGEGEQLAMPWGVAKSQLIRSRILYPPPGTEPGQTPPRRPPGYRPPRVQDIEKNLRQAEGAAVTVARIAGRFKGKG